ncbi:MAG TPA: gliding motility-associated C-terminal domain-containing protein [Bacteroidales bacterium]|nr:gliding motility-associated C-terminal domain-containing protein [Bacteroidales bacterium]
MNKKNIYNIPILLFLLAYCTYAQNTCETPLVPPVLTSVSVQPETGTIILNWTLSPDSDIAAYIIYSYSIDQGSRGDPIDTLWNPTATSYSYSSTASKYFSSSFVVTAFRIPRCEGPFSNVLSTIFSETQIDTCSRKILIEWNSYSSVPNNVLDYSLLVSINGGSFSEAARISSEANSFTLNDFVIDAYYCFFVRANLEGGAFSTSNKACLSTRMQRPPQWINADYATLNNTGDKIFLSFTYDPSSEINLFRLERKSGPTDTFQWVAHEYSFNGWWVFTDDKADILTINYYRLSAIHCNLPVVTSNISSNIVLTVNNTGNEIKLQWPSYKQWRGDIASHTLFMNTGRGYVEKASFLPADTTYTLNYTEIMYDIRTDKICFMVTSREGQNNPFGIEGVSRSNEACIDILENITVPNIFTPDGDLINDLFRPVLSFTPASYHLLITNRQGTVLFESGDPAEAWDGSRNGTPYPQDVCLWFLRVRTPSGKDISRTGTVSVFRNR